METVETTEKKELTQEEQINELKRLAEFKHKTYSKLLEVHLNNNLSVLMSTNGVSYNKKNQARKAIIEAFQLILDFGLGITNADITVKGKIGRDAAQMAGVFAQANDNRMLLLMDKLKNEETVTEKVTEKETQNV